MKLKELEDKKILILGFGREGKDTFRFLKKLFPNKVFGIADTNRNIKYQIANSKKVRWYLGKNYLKPLKDYDVIIKSPGIPPKVITPFVQKGQKISSQTEIFFENCPSKIIGITGTKGKSTTASLIYQILKAGGLKAYLIGNIGQPVLNLLLKAKEDDIYVYELSSHQLMNLKKSPSIAVLLNIYPEHLDYYRNFKEYYLAKANITQNQTKKDYLVFNSQDKIISAITKKSLAQKIPINQKVVTKIISPSEIPLGGKFYFLNIAAAIAVAKIFNIPDEKIKTAIKNFKPLTHRLELVGKFKGITFYNDSLATIPEATISALEALGSNVQTLIAGGFDRGLNFKNLAKEILKRNIKNLILFPTTDKKIWKALRLASLTQGKNLPNHFFINNMKQAVILAYQNTPIGKICLLSPASPSFGIFKDYRDRGEKFKKFVRKLK